MLLTVLVVFVVAWGNVLHYPMTGADALTLIETSRIDSPGDIWRILTEPMMNGSEAIELVVYFRPVTVFSYSIDQAIWGLNPFGYHLTDLILHFLVSMLLFILVRTMTRQDVAAWIAALIFVMHPVHVENVPAVARRHDMVAMLFMMPSLILFIRHWNGATGRRLFVASVALFAVALGGKEIAVILPFLIVAYTALYPRGSDHTLRGRLTQGFRAALPYFAVLLVFIAWRTVVLGGMGGEVQKHFGLNIISIYEIVTRYVSGLVEPYPLFKGNLHWGYAIVALAIFGFWMRWKMSHTREMLDVDHVTARLGHAMIFFCVWLVGPLGILLIGATFHLRYLYTPALAISGLLGVIVVDVARSLMILYRGNAAKALSRKRFILANVLLIPILVCVLSCLTVSSPVFRAYNSWRDTWNMAWNFLDDLGHAAERYPKGALLEIYHLPGAIRPPDAEEDDDARTAGGLTAYTVKSLLNIRYPDNTFAVSLEVRVAPSEPPVDVIMIEKSIAPAKVVMEIGLMFDEPQTVEEEAVRGYNYYIARDYGCSTYYLESYLRERPDDADAMVYLGMAHAAAGNDVQAEEWLHRAVRLNTESPVALRHAIDFYRDVGAYDDATQLCYRWLEQFPEDSAEAYQLLGWTHYKLYEYEDAAVYFTRAIELDRPRQAYYGAALVFFDKLHEYGRIPSIIDGWAEVEPSDPNLFMIQGLYAYHLGQFRKAEPNLARCLALGVAAPRVLDALATIWIEADEVESKFPRVMNWTHRFPDEPNADRWIAEFHARLGHCEPARRSLSTAQRKGLDDARLGIAKRVVEDCGYTRTDRRR